MFNEKLQSRDWAWFGGCLSLMLISFPVGIAAGKAFAHRMFAPKEQERGVIATSTEAIGDAKVKTRDEINRMKGRCQRAREFLNGGYSSNREMKQKAMAFTEQEVFEIRW